jgi:putative ABC transport system ATP-binding protein
MSVLIALKDVCKSYERGGQILTILNRLSLTVEEGDYVALMGPSGSGKSTLLNLIAGLDAPTSGAIQVGGIDIGYLSESQLAQWRARHIGFIFQFYNLMPVLNALENVELPLRLLPGLSSKDRLARARMVLELVGLGDRLDHVPSELSGGQQQRVAIARALVTDPDLIVADEPTGDLDRQTGEEILHLLGTLNRDWHKTILMVTHDPKAAQRARRVIQLEKGVIQD